jgi:hypothetical protein
MPDANLLSFTQHLDMTRAIVERVSAPVIADLDTGYGNAVNVLHVVGAYARAGVAAVVIEDRPFRRIRACSPAGDKTSFGSRNATAKSPQHSPPAGSATCWWLRAPKP